MKLKSGADPAGIILGLLSSAAFGMIPLFSLPLMRAGISVSTILTYRFAIAAAVIGIYLRSRGEKLLALPGEIAKLGLLSSMYLLAVAFFYSAFEYLPSGVTATIQFLYPVMVMLIMICFFHEPFYWPFALALLLAFCGVAALFWTPGLETGSSPHAAWGVMLALLAGLANCLYIVGLQVARLPHISGTVITFWVMLFGAFFCVIEAVCADSLQWIAMPKQIGLAIMLSLVTAVFSNLTLVMAVKRIGSTLASILGVMEPLTAVIIGTLVFQEPFTFMVALGVLLVAAAVAVVVLMPRKKA